MQDVIDCVLQSWAHEYPSPGYLLKNTMNSFLTIFPCKRTAQGTAKPGAYHCKDHGPGQPWSKPAPSYAKQQFPHFSINLQSDFEQTASLLCDSILHLTFILIVKYLRYLKFSSPLTIHSQIYVLLPIQNKFSFHIVFTLCCTVQKQCYIQTL